jgi:hypothetical protein
MNKEGSFAGLEENRGVPEARMIGDLAAAFS